jgi:hypothetical protein
MKKNNTCYTIVFHLDTNRINSNGKLPYINKLEKYATLDIIELEWSLPIYDYELTAQRHFDKASGRLVAHPAIRTPEEEKRLRQIEQILFPGGPRNRNERIDALALFTAKKYHAIFITDDGSGGKLRGILTHRQELGEIGVDVMTDAEALALIEEKLVRNINFLLPCSLLLANQL